MSRAIGKGHTHLGTMACLVCDREIPVKQTGGGKLSIACPWCDLPLYINPRTEAFDRVMKRVKLAEPKGDQVTQPHSERAANGESRGAPPASSSSTPAEEGPKKPPARGWMTGVGGNPFGNGG